MSDLRLGGNKWTLEHWETTEGTTPVKGLNIAKLSGSTNPGNYKLFIRENDGNVGIGAYNTPGKLTIKSTVTENWRPLLYIYSGSGITSKMAVSNNHTELYLYNYNDPSKYIRLRSENVSAVNELEVHGTLVVDGQFVNSSDKRLKTNIKKLDTQYEKLEQLETYTYNMLSDSAKAASEKQGADTIKKCKMKERIGFMAQEVQELFPDLVLEDEQGMLGIDYISMIPLLVEANKHKKAQLDELEKELEQQKTYIDRLEASIADQNERIADLAQFSAECCAISGNTKVKSGEEAIESTAVVAGNSAAAEARLEQNNPNPFSESTLISMFLPAYVQTATLYIYDLTGTQMSTMSIDERDTVTVHIAGNTLTPGMYLYSLVCNGELVATKQMIVTQ